MVVRRVDESRASERTLGASAFDFDLVVVGGGPAGASCALHAARNGARVALFEPQRAPLDKPCGEGIMPGGVDVLRALGMHDVIASGRSFAGLRFLLPRCAPLAVALPRAGVAIERPALQGALDAALQCEPNVTRFAEHVDVEAVAAATSRDLGVGFVARNKAREVQSRALVVADGLNGKCAAWLREEARATSHRADARIGVRLRCEARDELDQVEVHFGDGCEIYLTPLARGRVNVVVLVEAATARLRDAQKIASEVLSRHPAAARRLGACVTPPEARVLTRRRPRIVAENAAFLVGDAGGGVDPILGCGTTIALESGVHAAIAVRRILDDDGGSASDSSARGVHAHVSRSAERAYSRQYARATRARRPLAASLLVLARHPTLARATAAILRTSPALRRALVNLAAES